MDDLSYADWYALAHSAAKDYISKMQLESAARNYKALNTGEVEISCKSSKSNSTDPNLMNVRETV